MKKSRFSDSAIMAILKQAEEGSTVPDLCRAHELGPSITFPFSALRSPGQGRLSTAVNNIRGSGFRANGFVRYFSKVFKQKKL